MAVALFGILQVVYLLVALGAAMVFGAFFLFARNNQGTPAPAKEKGDSVPRR